MKRFADQLLRHVRPIGIGGVDAIDAKLGQPFQRAEGFRPVLGLASNALAGDAHGAEAETIDLNLAAGPELSRFCCVELCHPGDSITKRRI